MKCEKLDVWKRSCRLSEGKIMLLNTYHLMLSTNITYRLMLNTSNEMEMMKGNVE